VKRLIAATFGVGLVACMATAQPPEKVPGPAPRAESRPTAVKTEVIRPSRPVAVDPLVAPDLPAPARAADRIPAPTVPAPTPTIPPALAQMPYVVPVPVTPAAEPKPDDMTIDQLLEAVESLRAQKEAMEKREKAMLKALRQKAEKLNQRIGDLDGEARPQVIPTPVTQSEFRPAR
jgi:hypothetical protein